MPIEGVLATSRPFSLDGWHRASLCANLAIWFMNCAQVSGAGVGNVPAVCSIQGANAD
jgi:hypothetical protein